ncbi:MAG: hypothetical protein R2932_29245 [Caldilineaceae bacterium]
MAATLANPPVALTVGAIGGGALGWNWMQKQGKGSGTSDEDEGESGTVATVITEESTGATSPTATVPETPPPDTAADSTDTEPAEGSA